MADDSLADKKYKLQNKESSRRLQDFVASVSEKHLDITEKVLCYAEKKIGIKLNDSLYITLTDHINSALERYNDGIIMKNVLKFDIQKFYPKEFEISKKAVGWIFEKTGIDLGDDEAAFIAMHIVASESGIENTSNVQQITELIGAVLQIIRLYFGIDFEENSFSYQRFITHLKFFAARVFDCETYKDSMQEVFNSIAAQNPDIYECVKKIAAFINKRYEYNLSIDEVFYLMIHLKRILDEQSA